jgi:hypothetical protein
MHRLRGRPFIALRIPTFASTTVQMLWQCARVFFFLTRGAATPPDVTIRHMATHELLLWPLPHGAKPAGPLTMAKKVYPIVMIATDRTEVKL